MGVQHETDLITVEGRAREITAEPYLKELDYGRGLSVRIIFQNGVISRGNFRRIFDGAPQFKSHVKAALLANRKLISSQQCGFMHQTVRVVKHAIYAALWNEFSGPVLLFQNCLSSPR